MDPLWDYKNQSDPHNLWDTWVNLLVCWVSAGAWYLAQLANQNPNSFIVFSMTKWPNVGKCKLCDSKLVFLYSWICRVNLCNLQSHWRCWKGSPIIAHPVMKCCPIHRKPSLLDFEFIRECMTINKMCPKFHFLTKIEIRMTYLVLFVLLS